VCRVELDVGGEQLATVHGADAYAAVFNSNAYFYYTTTTIGFFARSRATAPLVLFDLFRNLYLHTRHNRWNMYIRQAQREDECREGKPRIQQGNEYREGST
jgi:hypothetical protein